MNLFIRHEDPNGKTTTFIPKKMAPLSFANLRSATNGGKFFTFQINATAIETEKDGIKSTAPDDVITMPINFHQPLPLYAITDGGWLPVPFVEPNYLLIDNNIVVQLEKLLLGKTHQGIAEIGWWIDQIGETDLTINPLLYALEGKKRQIPTFEEFKASLKEAAQTLQRKFPAAKIVQFTDEQFPVIYGEISKIYARFPTDSEFLKRSIPLIIKEVRGSDLLRVQREIFTLAKSLRLNRNSFALLVVLSSLFYKPLHSPGQTATNVARRILKPADPYTDEMAYNALVDLHCLEIYVSSLALSKSYQLPEFAFVTGDKSLALFGCGLAFHSLKFSSNGAEFKISIDNNLFGRLDTLAEAELLNFFAGL